MNRCFYSNSIGNFLTSSTNEIFGAITRASDFPDEPTQKGAWNQEIKMLKLVLHNYEGKIFFEYSIPRMGRRIDVVLIIRNVIFVVEFKVGEIDFNQSAVDQVWDYALDLKNFHETSHVNLIAPILVCTESKRAYALVSEMPHNDNLLFPIRTNQENLDEVIKSVLAFADGENVNQDTWASGSYFPTPTIIEAAMSLYGGHSVDEIARTDASAINLSTTTDAILKIIIDAKANNQKAICFVTGVPGAGKTLVGLNIGAKNYKDNEKSSTVFLSGNGPLVAILREALTRDKVKREKENGNKVRKGEVFSQVKSMIQNVHNFRDECLKDLSPPFEHVTIFDEAQRAWDIAQTSNFMKRKKNLPDFSISEPEFLISCMDRHPDWSVIVCLVGGGQEINTGEAGISEWIDSVNRAFPEWQVYVSDRLTDSEYAAGHALQLLEKHKTVFFNKDLHLAVSMRSFRA
ncbi:MAG: DNA/RNA helicase domain-containing protein, partial [Ginsengibacter sp.]